ncbi:MAG: peptide deformylase [Synergistaceae bacterium]|nr:peptide deformylase [Synergistaceae bacterium]
MMKRPVLILGDPLLRRKCAPVEDFSDPLLEEEMEDLREALELFRKEHGFGRGIAAPQIGIPKRLIALNLGKGSFVIANPEIVSRSPETFTLWDDCMSFPDLMVRVRRHRSVSIRYRDEKGAQKEWADLGIAESELLQHEMDHLDGVLAVDRAIGTGDIVYMAEYRKHKNVYDSQCDYSIVPTIGS